MKRTGMPSRAFAASSFASSQPVSSERKTNVWNMIDFFAEAIAAFRAGNECTPSNSGVTLLPSRAIEPVASSSARSNAGSS